MDANGLKNALKVGALIWIGRKPFDRGKRVRSHSGAQATLGLQLGMGWLWTEFVPSIFIC